VYVRQSLRPGQKGTKKLLARYGHRLVRVRYRYDPVRGRRLTTVELIVEEAPWQPRAAPRREDRLVLVRVAWGEAELGRRIKAAGGDWDRHRRAWELPYSQAVRLGLLDRIVDG
jgi:hypothetical protein